MHKHFTQTNINRRNIKLNKNYRILNFFLKISRFIRIPEKPIFLYICHHLPNIKKKTHFVIRSRTLVSFKRSQGTKQHIYKNRAKNWRAVSIRRRLISRGSVSAMDHQSSCTHYLSPIRKPPIRYQLPFVKSGKRSRSGCLDAGIIQANSGQSVELSDINHSQVIDPTPPPPPSISMLTFVTSTSRLPAPSWNYFQRPIPPPPSSTPLRWKDGNVSRIKVDSNDIGLSSITLSFGAIHFPGWE